MLKGSVLFFTYLITLFYLKKNLTPKKHMYMVFILISLIVIGASNIKETPSKCNTSIIKINQSLSWEIYLSLYHSFSSASCLSMKKRYCRSIRFEWKMQSFGKEYGGSWSPLLFCWLFHKLRRRLRVMLWDLAFWYAITGSYWRLWFWLDYVLGRLITLECL